MDEKTCNFLIENNLEMLIEKFKEEGIDTAALLIMKPENLKELCPQLGVRIKVQQHIEDLKSTAIVIEVPRTISTATTVPVEHESDILMVDSLDWKDLVVSSHSSVDDSTTSDKRKLDTTYDNNKKICATNFFENNVSLLEFLNGSSKGQTVVASYNKNQVLDAVDRRMLVHLVIDGLLDRHETVRGNMFLELAEEIVYIFPTEAVSTYYYFNRNISKNIKGKLIDRYKNERQYRQKNKPKNERIVNIEQPPMVSDDIQSKINWLRNSQEPWRQVQQYWLQTYDVHYGDFIGQKQLPELVNAWPLLKHAKGYTLVSFIAYRLLNLLIV